MPALQLEIVEYLHSQAGDVLRPVAEFESKQDPCGSYVALAPLEGDDKPVTVFETYVLQSVIVSMALSLTHRSYDDASYLENIHMKSDAFVNLRESVPRSSPSLRYC
jgi:hypothetical protein